MANSEIQIMGEGNDFHSLPFPCRLNLTA